MKRIVVKGLATVLAACASQAGADATLVYRLSGENSPAVEKTFSVARFFVRVDSSDAPGQHLLYQAGKFFPLFRVDRQDRMYTRLTPPVRPRLGPVDRGAGKQQASAETQSSSPPASGDKTPGQAASADARGANPTSETGHNSPASGIETRPKTPALQPTERMDTVGGVRCRVVMELVDGEPAVEHCMANTAALGITERETRSLARLFGMARQRGWDWLPAATGDEEFVSVRSRRAADAAGWTLESVSTAALPAGHMRISRDFRERPREQPPSEKRAGAGVARADPAAPDGQSAASPSPDAAAGQQDIEAETPTN